MRDTIKLANPPLEAASPFELRVDLGTGVSEADVRSALATGDMGFLHSFTTGSTVDGPGVRVVAWTTGCMWRCLYCHNPDTWTMSNGIPVTVEHAAAELRKYRHGLKVMAGGFTLSGGEPLMQHRFVVKLVAAARAMGIHTAVQTNGHYGDKLSDAELEAIDLVLLDLKMWDTTRHRELTGMDGDTTLGNVRRVDVLPFHQLGRYKWKELGLPYALERTEPPTEEAVAQACGVFRAEGLTAY
jgi:pyruvate formate lyase activating enzyme